MAKKRSARTAARKVKDKWRQKQWYTIKAPQVFNEAELGETLAEEPEKLEGRVAESTLQDVTGDFSKMHVKCYFRIRGTRGTDAVTTFDGHDLTSDYVRRLVRRGHSKIDDVVDVTTTDGFSIRLKPMVVTERRVQASQGTAIRKIARDVIEEKAKQPYNELVREIVQGDVAKGIYDKCRLIMPLKRVEIRKSELLSEPQDATELLDVFAPPPEPEEDEAADAASEEDGADDEEATDSPASDEPSGEEEADLPEDDGSDPEETTDALASDEPSGEEEADLEEDEADAESEEEDRAPA